MGKQYVCVVCGYNMIGKVSDECPFCHADKSEFLTAEECSDTHFVVENPVNSKISRVSTTPKLGLEHAAYRITTADKVVMIDCPCCYDDSLAAVDIITFTHSHFVGAANMYQEKFGAELWMHQADTTHPILADIAFDNTFTANFTLSGVEAFHLGGHTPGYTVYFFEDVLFVCDMVWIKDGVMTFNPYSDMGAIREAAVKLKGLVAERNIVEVCGWNSVLEYSRWLPMFEALLASG